MRELKNKLLPRKKFLKTQQKSYNTISLQLHSDYPDQECILKEIKNNMAAINGQINVIDNILKAIENYNKDKKEIGKDLLICLGTLLVLLTIIVLLSPVLFWTKILI